MAGLDWPDCLLLHLRWAGLRRPRVRLQRLTIAEDETVLPLHLHRHSTVHIICSGPKPEEREKETGTERDQLAAASDLPEQFNALSESNAGFPKGHFPKLLRMFPGGMGVHGKKKVPKVRMTRHSLDFHCFQEQKQNPAFPSMVDGTGHNSGL